MTFRRRLTLTAALAVAVAVVAASLVTYVVVRSELRGEVDRSLEEIASRVSDIPRPDILPGVDLSNLPGPPQPLGDPLIYVQLVTPGGDVVSFPSSTPFRIPVKQPTAGGTELEDQTVDGVHFRVRTVPMKGGYVLQLARPLTEVDDTLRRLAVVLAFVTGAGVAIAAGLGTVVTRTAVAPVARLTEAAERVTATGDLSHRIEISGAPSADELARLATSFNAMLEALEGSVLAQRRLVADASHELRTPLTSLRTNVELLASGRELASGERERLLADATAQLEELSTIVADLVELARGGDPVLVEQDVRLDDLVREAVERAERDAPTATFSIEAPPVVVRGDPSLLGRAIANLLDNAVKWSQRVEVTVEPGAVAVRDHGPGFDPADLPHVFDRFYRSTAARGTPGSGLGLAIVKQVAEAHGGRAVARNAPDGGAIVRLELGAERFSAGSQVPLTEGSPTEG